MTNRKRPVVGIVLKPFLRSQLARSLWDDLYVKQNFTDILYKNNTNFIGIIPPGIILDRENSDDTTWVAEEDLNQKEKEYLVNQIQLCDGIILQGGLSSHKYENFIAQYAIDHNIPILGICAGFNNITRAVGTDVKLEENLSNIHNIYSKDPCHKVSIQSGGYLSKFVSSDSFFVNSLHSMLLKNNDALQNERILVEAIAVNDADVTVEAFSVKDTRFCLAIKWHPELLPEDEITCSIFAAFSEECEKYCLEKMID